MKNETEVLTLERFEETDSDRLDAIETALVSMGLAIHADFTSSNFYDEEN